MEIYRKAYQLVIKKIDWRKIKNYHKKLDILWEIQEDKQVVKIVPPVDRLKEDLSSIFEHMLSENLSYISHGNWIVYWDRSPIDEGNIRLIFRIAEFTYENNVKSIEKLKSDLNAAVDEENYEYAAILRDEIYKKNDINKCL